MADLHADCNHCLVRKRSYRNRAVDSRSSDVDSDTDAATRLEQGPGGDVHRDADEHAMGDQYPDAYSDIHLDAEIKGANVMSELTNQEITINAAIVKGLKRIDPKAIAIFDGYTAGVVTEAELRAYLDSAGVRCLSYGGPPPEIGHTLRRQWVVRDRVFLREFIGPDGNYLEADGEIIDLAT